MKEIEIEGAKVYHFEHDPAGIFTSTERLSPGGARPDGGEAHE